MTRGELPNQPDGRPTYDQADGPSLDGLGPLQKAQVVQAINTALLAEVVRHAGGRVVLPPGFVDRLDITETVVTRFLEDGSYEVKLMPLPEVLERLGEGRRFVRVTDPRNTDPDEVFEIVEAACDGEPMAGLQRVLPTPGALVVRVKAEYLRRRVGWRPWYPPADDVERVAGKRFDR